MNIWLYDHFKFIIENFGNITFAALFFFVAGFILGILLVVSYQKIVRMIKGADRQFDEEEKKSPTGKPCKENKKCEYKINGYCTTEDKCEGIDRDKYYDINSA